MFSQPLRRSKLLTVCTTSLLAIAGSPSNAIAGDYEVTFENPVRLMTEDGPVATGRAFEGLLNSGAGYAGPHVTDFNGDGTPDLLVGEIYGFVYFFQGHTTGTELSYADPEPVRMHDGEALKFSNW